MIIENTGKGAAWTRRRDAVLSAAMWGVYLYWIREAFVDVATLAADAFAWAFLGAAQPELQAIALFGTTVLPYLAVVAANAALLILWARYNQVRFRGHERHRNAISVGPAELGTLYSMNIADVVACQASRLLTIRHSPDGTIAQINFDQNGAARVWTPSDAASAEGGSEIQNLAAVSLNSPS
jgi:biofilm PGA synthesis protein PgaD